MRPSQLDVNLLSNTNCNLSNSINLHQETEALQGDDNRQQSTDLYIDQLVDINDRLIQLSSQIGSNIKDRLIPFSQWLCLNEATSAEADDMIKIDSDPIKIDGVIGRITEMDEPDNQFVTLERQMKIALEQVQRCLSNQQLQITLQNEQIQRWQRRNSKLRRQIEATVD